MRYFFLFFLFIFIWRWHLPPQLPAQEKIFSGAIATIPAKYSKAWEFIFIPEHTTHRLWVSWYAPPPVHLHIGDVWELCLRLKPASHLWLYTQQINATANVQRNWHTQILYRDPWLFPLEHVRENIYQDLQTALQNNNALGFISALSIGMRDRITKIQWQDLRNTGTNHLMAIAGLHIGFVVFISYSLFNWLWRRSSRLMLWRPAQEAATVFSLFCALMYVAISGFALPAQRALIMLMVFLITRLTRRMIPLWHSWLIALCCVLMLNPLSILTASFWLSFGAVALLIFGLGGRLHIQGWWWHWARPQWVMAVGLLPFGVLFFQQISWIGFVANIIAIPFVGFLILPLCLLATLCCGIYFKMAAFLWQLAANLLMAFWKIMHWLGQLPDTQIQHLTLSPFLILCAIPGLLLFLAPKGWPARWIGLLWISPLITHIFMAAVS